MWYRTYLGMINKMFLTYVTSEMVYISEKECNRCTLVRIVRSVLKTKTALQKSLCFSKIGTANSQNGYKFTYMCRIVPSVLLLTIPWYPE